MAFARKVMQATFTLQTGTFEGTSSNTLTLPIGLRMHLTMSQAGGVSKDNVRLTIWGMTKSQINQLSTYGMPPDISFNNRVQVMAGDANGPMSNVFLGSIRNAYADYNSPPDACFVVEAYQLYYESAKTIPATSYPGPVSVASVMQQLAGAIGLTLENNGVSIQLPGFYSYGSAVDQIKDCAQHANINFYPDVVQGVLAIWPKNQSRDGAPVLISPETGLKSYPMFQLQSIVFETLFNPGIRFMRKVQVQSSLQPACGVWVASDIQTDLQTETPDGAWFQTVKALAPGLVANS